jgi:4-alpha-glucanotransferase
VASLNTHDMPTFKAFWTAADVDDRLEMGLLTQQEADAERAGRAAVRDHVAGYLADSRLLPHFTHEPSAVFEALLTWLGTSSARFVLANLEDLWGESQPQNTPGTWLERCNWRRKARYTLEQFRNLPEVVSALYNLEQARRQAAIRPFVLPPPHYLPQGVAGSRRS